MFDVFKNAWKVEDLREKLLYTLLIVVIFRLGSAIPVPFLEPSALSAMLSANSGNLLGYLNMLTGRRGQIAVDYWTPTNTGARYPLPGGVQSGDNPKYGSTLAYFDGSYLKSRTITLGYNFEKIGALHRA